MENDTLLEKVTEVDGCRVLGPCAIYSRLGQGGMGAVYRARHMNLGIDVAVKCLKPSLADAQFVKRFKLEAKSAARIGHQNVVRVFDVAEDQGLHYIIMELVQGETARQRVERKGPLAIGEALEILHGAAQGLAEAHRKGIIHRDIKPDNILISSRGEVKLVDLGLAKPSFRDDSNSVLSSPNQMMGTLQYMPPEQWESTSDVTMAADVWALGATFFFLVTGREAINNGTPPQIMNRIVNLPFPDVRRVRDDVPDEVIALLARATAKAVQDRFEDAEALATAIAELETRRSGLRDSEAGTTQLRTLVSPPPQRTLDKIQTMLQTGPQYPGARLQTEAVPSALPRAATAAPRPASTPPSAPAATQSQAKAGSGRRAALVLLVLLLGAGASLFVPSVRQWVVGPPAPVDPLPGDAERKQPSEGQRQQLIAEVAKTIGEPLAFSERLAPVQPINGRAVTGSDTIQLRGRLSDPDASLFLRNTEIKMVVQDGSFTCAVRVPDEGENDLEFEARKREQPRATCRLQVLRLVKPEVTVEADPTESARCLCKVTADVWTRTVDVTVAGKTFSLRQSQDDMATFTGEVELAQGLNDGEIVATNVVEQQTVQRQEFKRFPTLESVTIVMGTNTIDVKQGARIHVRSKQAKVRAVTAAAGAKLSVNGRLFEDQDLAPGVDLDLEDLKEGVLVPVSFQVGFPGLGSKPWQAEFVLDTVQPELSDLKSQPLPPQPAGTEITISGAWQDECGCTSITVDNNPAVVTAGKPGIGSFSVKLKSPDKTRDLVIVAKDQAGNELRVPLPFEVAAPPPPPPAVIPERVFEPEGFVRKTDCKVENGYPEFLVHKATGIELVANEFGPGKKPGYYIATRETTEQQWGEGSSTKPKVSVTYYDVERWLKEPPRRSLDLPTEQEWEGMPSQWQQGQGYSEWLKSQGGTTAPLRKDRDQKAYAQHKQLRSISFRVVYRVR